MTRFAGAAPTHSIPKLVNILRTREASHRTMTVGLLVQLANLAFVPHDPEMLRQVIGFGSAGFLIGGGAMTSSSKGYSPWLGLLGLFSFVGMGIILLLPAKDSLFPKKRGDQGDTEKP